MEERTIWTERCELAAERLDGIRKEAKKPFWAALFRDTAAHLLRLCRLMESVQTGVFADYDAAQKRLLAKELWSYSPDIQAEPERFRKLAELLVYEWQNLIPSAYRLHWKPFVLYAELLIQIYGTVQELADSPDALYHELRDILYWFYSDNSEIFCEEAAYLLFVSEQEKARVLGIDRQDTGYLYESGCQIDEAAQKRANCYASCSAEEVEAEAREIVCRVQGLSGHSIYLGFEPGMEPLAAVCIRLMEQENRTVRLFPEQLFLPLRSPAFLRQGSVRIRPEKDGRAEEEYLILDSRYRERKIEVWREACKRCPWKEDAAGSLILTSGTGIAAGKPELQTVSKTGRRLAKEADETISGLLGERILLSQSVIIIQK